MSSLSQEILRIVDEQGWDDFTMVELAARFVDARKEMPAFADFLRAAQAEENSSIDVENRE